MNGCTSRIGDRCHLWIPSNQVISLVDTINISAWCRLNLFQIVESIELSEC